MPQIVSTWNELLEAGIDVITEKINPEDLRINKNLTIQISIKGESWDGFIDYRIANFILELQKAANNIYRELTIKPNPAILKNMSPSRLKLKTGRPY